MTHYPGLRLWGAAPPTSSAALALSAVTEALVGELGKTAPGFFKSVTIAGSSPTLEDRRKPGTKDYHKPLPRLAVAPSYNFEPAESGDSLKTERLLRIRDRTMLQDMGHMKALYVLERPPQTIRYETERRRTSYEFIAQLETPIQRANFSEILDQTIHAGHMRFLNGVPVPVEIPNTLLSAIARGLGVPTKTEAQAAEFIRHLDRHSRERLNWRINSANGRGALTVFIKTNLLVMYERPSGSDARRGLSQTESNVSFSASVEFPMTTYFTAASDGVLTDDEDAGALSAEGHAVCIPLQLSERPPREKMHAGLPVTLRTIKRFEVSNEASTYQADLHKWFDEDLSKFVQEKAKTPAGRKHLSERFLIEVREPGYDEDPSGNEDDSILMSPRTDSDLGEYEVDWNSGCLLLSPNLRGTHEFSLWMDWGDLADVSAERVDGAWDGLEAEAAATGSEPIRLRVGDEDSLLATDDGQVAQNINEVAVPISQLRTDAETVEGMNDGAEKTKLASRLQARLDKIRKAEGSNPIQSKALAGGFDFLN